MTWNWEKNLEFQVEVKWLKGRLWRAIIQFHIKLGSLYLYCDESQVKNETKQQLLNRHQYRSSGAQQAAASCLFFLDIQRVVHDEFQPRIKLEMQRLDYWLFDKNLLNQLQLLTAMCSTQRQLPRLYIPQIQVKELLFSHTADPSCSVAWGVKIIENSN